MSHPNAAQTPLQVLETVRFWMQQQREHAVLLRELLPLLEPGFADRLQMWEAAFARSELLAQQALEATIRSMGNEPAMSSSTTRSSASGSPGGQTSPAAWPPPTPPLQPLQPLLQRAAVEAAAFVRQLHELQGGSKSVRSGSARPLLLMHMIRESDHALGQLRAALSLCSAPQQLQPPAPNRPSPNPADPDNPDEMHLSLTGEGLWSGASLQDAKGIPVGGHALPSLPYNYHALEPYIDEKTMRIHHGIHHKADVDGLNRAEQKLAEARAAGTFELIRHWERELAHHGAGHYLHTLYWSVMSPRGGGEPDGDLAKRLARDFGSVEAFRQQFTAAAEQAAGSGWTLLVWSPRSARLEVLLAEQHQIGSQWDVLPLLPLDLWEHAYYLKYQHNRADYIRQWWKLVHWPYVSERFRSAAEIKWQPF